MKNKTTWRVVASALPCSLLLLYPASRAAAEEVPGELWDVTSQMSMEDMPIQLPSQTMQVCAPKENSEPPPAPGPAENCKTSGFTKNGTTSTWTVSCAGPPPVKGVGQMTRTSADRYTATIKYESSDGAMTMTINGKRIGTCTVGSG
jgi:hypothetical protein